jgi:hypothetical protein
MIAGIRRVCRSVRTGRPRAVPARTGALGSCVSWTTADQTPVSSLSIADILGRARDERWAELALGKDESDIRALQVMGWDAARTFKLGEQRVDLDALRSCTALRKLAIRGLKIETPGITHERIETHRWSPKDDTPSLNVWDFGGQEQMRRHGPETLARRNVEHARLAQRRRLHSYVVQRRCGRRKYHRKSEEQDRRDLR